MSKYDQHDLHLDPRLQERQAKVDYEKNQQDLLKNLAVTQNRDGTGSFFGMKVSESMMPLANLLVSIGMIPMAKGASNFVYNQTKSLAERPFFNKHIASMGGNPAKIALYAELATMWGILTAKPVSEFLSANKEYASERLTLSKEIKSIVESTGVDAAHNDVVNAAYNQLHQNWIDDLKMSIPSLLATIPHFGFAAKQHNSILEKRSVDIDAAKLATTSLAASGKTSENYQEEIRTKRADAMRKKYKERYQTYLEDHPGLHDNAESMRLFQETDWKHFTAGMPEHTEGGKKAEGFLNFFDGDTANFTTISGLTSAAGEGMAIAMRKERDAHKRQHNSFELIKQLNEQMEGRQSVQSVHKAVVEIFQQVEVDRGGSKFSGGLMEKLQELTQPIAEAIANRKLDAIALMKIAGESKVVMHTGNNRSFRSRNEVEQLVEEMFSAQASKEKEMSEEEFIAAFANPELAKNTIKKTLEELNGDERNFFVSIMPTEILEKAGMKLEEIRKCRTCAHDHLHEQLAASVMHLASREVDDLKESGLTERNIYAIKKLSEEIGRGSTQALKGVIDTHDDLLAAIASAEVNEQIKGNKQVWAERVQEGKSIGDRLEQIKEQKKERQHQLEGMMEQSGGEEQSPHMAERSANYMEQEKLRQLSAAQNLQQGI